MTTNQVGILYTLAFVVSSSAIDVFLASYIQNNDVILTVCGTFLFAIIFFSLAVGRRWYSVFTRVQTQSWRFFSLNFFTTINWLGFFWSLKFIEPVLSAAIAFALVPSLTMLLTPLMRKKNPSSTLEKVSAVGLLLSIAYMSYGELSGTGGISNISLTDRVFGVSLALSTSVGIVLNSFVTKKVVELGFKATEIMAFRFYGVVVATLAILLIRGTPVVGVDAHWFGFIAILSILLVVVPIYLVQKGIEKSEPITVSLLWSLTPAVTLTFQTIEGRLHPTLESVLGTTLCCFFAFLGAWAGSQKKIPAA